MCEEQKMSSHRLRCLSVTWNYLLIDSFPRSPQDSYLRVWSSQIACLSFVPKSTATKSIPLTWGVKVFKAATSCGQNDRTYLSDRKKTLQSTCLTAEETQSTTYQKSTNLGGGFAICRYTGILEMGHIIKMWVRKHLFFFVYKRLCYFRERALGKWTTHFIVYIHCLPHKAAGLLKFQVCNTCRSILESSHLNCLLPWVLRD